MNFSPEKRQLGSGSGSVQLVVAEMWQVARRQAQIETQSGAALWVPWKVIPLSPVRSLMGVWQELRVAQVGQPLTLNLSGTGVQIEAAELIVQQLVNDNTEQDFVMVKGDQLPAVLGKGGGTIRSIEEESGAKLTVPKEGRDADEVPVTISGSEDAIEKAKQMISDVLQQNASTDVMLDAEWLRAVIGQGGKEIKELQQQSGARMSVQRDKSNPRDLQCLRISGTEDQVAFARQAVQAANPGSKTNKVRCSCCMWSGSLTRCCRL